MTSSTRWRASFGVVVLFGAAAGVAAFQATAGRPMVVDDLIGAVRVADPQLSPDGRTVVYTRTTTDLKTGARNADLWAVPANGSGQPRELIAGARSENSARFLGSGSRLAFISSRDGAPQVYVADADGRNLTKVTDLAMGVQPPLIVSPDGSRVAFVSDVYPECTTEDCNKKKMDEVEKNPVKARRLTRLLYRHWDEWRENIRHHVFVADVAGGGARDVTPGDFDSPPVQQEDAAIAFSPDGMQIAFASSREGADAEAWTTNHEVFVVPVRGGAARKVTTNPGSDLTPAFGPDGTLYVRAQRRAGFEADRWYLDAYDGKTGAKRTVFQSPDLSVSAFTVSRDGATVWFAAGEEGREHVFTVPAAGGTPKRVLQGGAISALQLGAGFVVFSTSTLTAPTDIFRASADGTAVTPLTRENDAWLKQVAFSTPESLTVTAPAGDKIQYWLIRPPNFDASRKYPVVFLIHGGPQGAWMDSWSSRWNPSLWAAQGWVVAAPNPSGSTTFGQPMVDRISADWGGRVMDELTAVFDAVTKMPFVDAQRQAIAGASYGGYAVNWIIGHTNRFKAAVTHDGVFNLESMSLSTEELWFTEWEFGGRPWDAKAREQFARWSPHLYAPQMKTPTLIITNELDFRVPVDQGLQMFTALRRNGVPAEAIVFPDEGHWVLKALNSRYWHESVFGWIKKYLG